LERSRLQLTDNETDNSLKPNKERAVLKRQPSQGIKARELLSNGEIDTDDYFSYKGRLQKKNKLIGNWFTACGRDGC
jgi:hypothetical protein